VSRLHDARPAQVRPQHSLLSLRPNGSHLHLTSSIYLRRQSPCREHPAWTAPSHRSDSASSIANSAITITMNNTPLSVNPVVPHIQVALMPQLVEVRPKAALPLSRRRDMLTACRRYGRMTIGLGPRMLQRAGELRRGLIQGLIVSRSQALSSLPFSASPSGPAHHGRSMPLLYLTT
jgi:hypothetical protein